MIFVYHLTSERNIVCIRFCQVKNFYLYIDHNVKNVRFCEIFDFVNQISGPKALHKIEYHKIEYLLYSHLKNVSTELPLW